MSSRLLPLSALLLLGGCLWPVRDKVDQGVLDLASHPYDVAPAQPAAAPATPRASADKGAAGPPAAPGKRAGAAPTPPTDVQTTALMQAAKPEAEREKGGRPKLDLTIPPQIPGSEAPRVVLPEGKGAKLRAIARLYPTLPALPAEPKPLPGPGGKPYTLADLQRLAAENSPALRQAAADVETALGNLIQARMYPNPTIGYQVDPANDNSTGSSHGGFIDQVIKTGGKLKLAAAAAEMDLRNAQLALKRARSDLATAVRNAYYSLLVARETMVVSRALANFTDEIYRLQAELLAGGFAAPYEPAALRAQAYAARLAYKQAAFSYAYAWKQLVATVGVRQLPLSEVSGRVDRLIPYFDYDAVLARALGSHTDVLTARNTLEKARYNLQLAQITPVSDVEVQGSPMKDTTTPPHGTYHTALVSVTAPIWDQNKGGIIAAQGALIRATEEAHRVEVTITNNLATAYADYKNNLAALEYYRRYILPDQVRAYRGVYARRRIDPNVAFGDLVTAQQALATGVTTYLANLGSLWTAVVAVADFLQTDDLFGLGQPRELPPLPDLSQLPPWACPHCGPPPAPAPLGIAGPGVPLPAPAPPAELILPAPRRLE
jgi:cobalt-zinc-cadmium efflux system outer membrane protein